MGQKDHEQKTNRKKKNQKDEERERMRDMLSELQREQAKGSKGPT